MSIDLFNEKILPLKDKSFRLAGMIVRAQREAENVEQKKEKWQLIDNIEAYAI